VLDLESMAKHRDLISLQTQPLDVWEPLPSKVHIKNNAWYYVHNNKWHKLSRSGRLAKARYAELLSELGLPHVEPDFLKFLYLKAKSRAKRLKVDFELTLDDVRSLFEEGGGKC